MQKVMAENLISYGGLSLREVSRDAVTVIPEKNDSICGFGFRLLLQEIEKNPTASSRFRSAKPTKKPSGKTSGVLSRYDNIPGTGFVRAKAVRQSDQRRVQVVLSTLAQFVVAGL